MGSSDSSWMSISGVSGVGNGAGGGPRAKVELVAELSSVGLVDLALRALLGEDPFSETDLSWAEVEVLCLRLWAGGGGVDGDWAGERGSLGRLSRGLG